MGGENTFALAYVVGAKGSSPRGRGKLRAQDRSAHHLGLIPAWAGKTPTRRMAAPCPWAHPRVGGENRRLGGRRRRYQGSSPRGRGKRCGAPFERETLGLIPAWAGKTVRLRRIHRHLRAHPRVGGENRSRSSTSRRYGGSSPRGRGKRQRTPRVGLAKRLIPAWAGKTRLGLPNHAFDRAHPRVGGENSR